MFKEQFKVSVRRINGELIPNGEDAYAFLAPGLDLIGKMEEAILMSNLRW